MSNKKKDTTHTTRMSLRDYRERLSEYNQDYLLCKDLRHLWQVQESYTPYADTENWMHRVLTCARCGTTRTDTFFLNKKTKRMERGGSTYRYPSGFSMRGLPQEKHLGEVMRYESFLRTLAANKQEN